MFKQYKLYHVLVFLIFLDILLTILGVKYFGATELNPLCVDFEIFIIIKILVSGICLLIIYVYREDTYIRYAVYMSIILYIAILISNFWHTANYLYY